MLSSDYKLSKEEYLHREELRSFYNSSVGIEELSSLVLISGLLSPITDESGMVAHNIAVQKLEEIGLLDEEALRPTIKFLLGYRGKTLDI